MAKDDNSQRFLFRLSVIFEREGDTQTAQALRVRLDDHPLNGFTPDGETQLDSMRKRAQAQCKSGALDHAEELLGDIFQLHFAALGPEHRDTLQALSDLAGCLVQNYTLGQGQDAYERLVRVATTCLGTTDPFTLKARESLLACQFKIQQAGAIYRLGEQIDQMLRAIQNGKQVDRLLRGDRLYSLACRLLARGQTKRAVRAFDAWIGTRLGGTRPDDEDAIQDIARLAKHLGQAGELARAERTYRNIVSIRNRQNHLGTKSDALRLALSDWSVSLDKFGDQKSAQATIELAGRIL